MFLYLFVRAFPHKIQHRCFQSTVAKIEIAAFQHGPGELDVSRIAALGPPVDFRTARVGQFQQFGHLVERLTHRIVAGLSHNAVLQRFLNQYNLSVSSGNHQAEEGVRYFRSVQEVCKDVSLHVVHAHKREVQGHCEAFCVIHPYQKSTYQSGAVGDSDGLQVFQIDSGLLKCLVNDWYNFPQMSPGS